MFIFNKQTNNLTILFSYRCKLPAQINKRHMVVARFKQPINISENANEVRLLMLIVTPSKDKSTKNALETGRNFATMLVDSAFRLKLLEAKDEVEFKSLMMVKAQQLAKSRDKLKNRHKYILDAAVHLSMSSLNYLTNDNCSEGNCGPCPLKQREEELTRFGRRSENSSRSTKSAGENMEVVVFNKHPRQSKLIDLISSKPIRTEVVHSSSSANAEKAVNGSKVAYQSQSTCWRSLGQLEFGKGLWRDFSRRVRLYPSDFKDAFVGPPKTLQKTIATVWFLYFGILLPTIAFSALNTHQTNGHMGDLRKAIIGQAIGGLAFAYFGGQPLVIIMTTAPLCLYTKG